MLQFTLNSERDPYDASLRKLLEAHVKYERMSAARSFSLHLLAIVSAVVWLGVVWPSLLPSQVRAVALALWAVLLLFAVCAGAEEWAWHRKVARYRSEHQAKQQEGAG
jgi:Na+/H+ antiporter NhaD/arsenite permease-like protein